MHCLGRSMTKNVINKKTWFRDQFGSLDFGVRLEMLTINLQDCQTLKIINETGLPIFSKINQCYLLCAVFFITHQQSTEINQ